MGKGLGRANEERVRGKGVRAEMRKLSEMKTCWSAGSEERVRKGLKEREDKGTQVIILSWFIKPISHRQFYLFYNLL